MFRKKAMIGLSLLLLLMSAPGSAMAADKTTKYRVYQDDKILLETSDYKTAENYAKQFASSHVEDIGTRKWLWHNYPRYKLYQYDYSSSEWEFATLDQAVAEARKWSHASIRDLQSGGWVWNNYPKYRVYQGDITLDGWEFATLDQAVAEAKKWANSHIIDLKDHRWVWDNIPASVKNDLRTNGSKIYQVYQGTYTSEDWKFSYLEDAVNESLKWADSTIVNLEKNNQAVFSNIKHYRVYQNSNLLQSFLNVDDAINYAKLWAHAKVVYTGMPERPGSYGIWNNYPYYQVYQDANLINEFNTIPEALSYAMYYSNASIRLLDGTKIWDNFRKLQFWGWNGSSSDATIRGHVANTLGLDVDSPTYFELADSSGGLNDKSNKDTVAWLKNQGYKVYPLVSNQFDTALTSQFLANPQAQSNFIQALVKRATELGVHGLNIDFENVSGKDRAAFTAFMKNLTDAAHQNGLIISIDLPRGSLKWNAQTAFDHEKLAGIVDYIVIMAYDQYYSGSKEPGSVAGLDWVEEGVEEFLTYGIPRDKLIMGIPLYVREWKLDSGGNLVSNRALMMKDLTAWISSKKATLTWDERFKQYRAEYSEDGYNYVFWLENEDSVKARIDIAKKYDLAGVAMWRLGYDSADLWKSIIQQK